MKKVGRVGGKALLYFEVVSTVALVIGLVVGNWLHPGAGFGAIQRASMRAVAVYAAKPRSRPSSSSCSTSSQTRSSMLSRGATYFRGGGVLVVRLCKLSTLAIRPPVKDVD